MTHYFLGMALLTAPALLATALSGVVLGGGETHVLIGLTAAVITLATHTLLILFMIVTGKVMKAAMEARSLPPEFLAELNRFFAQKTAYPVSALAALSIVAVGVLGYAQRGFGLPAEAHLLLGVAALAFNLWALTVELAALRENQTLLDRTARALDAIDRERAAVPGAPEAAEEEEAEPPPTPGRWLVFAAAAWTPYLYWGLIEWNGDFSRIGPWFPALSAVVSGAGLLAAWNARGADAAG